MCIYILFLENTRMDPFHFSKTNAMLKAMVKGTNNVNIRIIKYKIDNKSLPYRFRRVYNSTIKT